MRRKTKILLFNDISWYKDQNLIFRENAEGVNLTPLTPPTPLRDQKTQKICAKFGPLRSRQTYLILTYLDSTEKSKRFKKKIM